MDTVVFLAGLALIVTGVALWSYPSAFVVAGVFAVAAAWLYAISGDDA